jgi:hypothetical protein
VDRDVDRDLDRELQVSFDLRPDCLIRDERIAATSRSPASVASRRSSSRSRRRTTSASTKGPLLKTVPLTLFERAAHGRHVEIPVDGPRPVIHPNAVIQRDQDQAVAKHPVRERNG